MTGLPIRLLIAAWLLLAAAPTTAGPAGTYRLIGEQDVASGLRLNEDGSFQYFLSAGALDEEAEGRWTLAGRDLHLTTEPKPIPPSFSAGPVSLSNHAPLRLKVVWPDGRGIANVDFRIGFESGDPLVAYTQEDGWAMSAEEKRTPLWIELAVPMHAIESNRFLIEAAKANDLVFILTANDLGKVDFGALRMETDGDRILLHRFGQTLTYAREP
ncbi:hypothetical protein [Sphingosinicella rhizophila]|uniref:Uncharacterized protein n=1 Tax=Sphingosinicella rhizophila TaxID=3050082 RepID=A0ABU3Q7E9_9SPHN|nr:hypothetical protein [Sphingosinicella sp. GR2756]MDT9599332.1 hypothetical protein [Sphingosinicella sp. GR2756]